jgi:hypothetical protein
MAIRDVLREVCSDGRDVTVIGAHLLEGGREVALPREGAGGYKRDCNEHHMGLLTPVIQSCASTPTAPPCVSRSPAACVGMLMSRRREEAR